MPRLTAAQRDRSTYLGATDIAVLAGVDDRKSVFDLWLEKIGELDPEARRSEAERGRMERGHRLEDVALDWYADIHGVRIDRIRRDVVHPRLPFVITHPDGRARPWRDTRLLYEAKTTARPWAKDPETGDLIVPQRTQVQVQAQMAAARADAATVVVLGFDGPPAGPTVIRDDAVIRELEAIAEHFWTHNVLGRSAPPIDGSRGASRYLDSLFNDGPELRADPQQAAALKRLLQIRRELIPALEAEDDRIVNALKFSMAGGTRLIAPGVGKVTWTKPGKRREARWSEIAEALRERWLAEFVGDERLVLEAELDEIVATHTTVTEGVRTFRPEVWKEAASS